MNATFLLGIAVIVAAVVAIVKRVDVRLALLAAALALGALAGTPMLIVRTFLGTFASEQFLVPIGCAVGFSYVLRHTGCEQHLVQLLVRPLRRARFLVVPGAVLVGFAVNCPVVSQTATAVSVGAVLVPLMRAAGVTPVTTGASLLLGCSVGGELLNPGAPEWLTVARALDLADTNVLVGQVAPLLLVQLGVAMGLFLLLNRRADAAEVHDAVAAPPSDEPAFRVHYLKAIVPLVPVVLLFLTGPPLNVLKLETAWLGDTTNEGSRRIGAAMLVGVVLAAATAPRQVADTAKVFFDGAGYALTHIVSLIVAASCFGKGVEGIGVKNLVGDLIGGRPAALVAAAGALPLAFACLSGSGMAATQALYGFFVAPAGDAGVEPRLVGAVVAIAAAAGRTMSPAAAIVFMAARLTDAEPLALVRRVALPLLAATTATVATALALSR